MAEAASNRSFLIRELLGTGGFGEVYRAVMNSTAGLQTEVAVKLIHDPRPDAIRRMRDEGRLLASLRHPAILRVLDLTSIAGRVALVTEYVAGKDLSSFVQGPHAIPMRPALEVVAGVADALHAAWDGVDEGRGRPLRLVHRDIKPSNIRIGTHGEVKVLDFGIAYTEEATREAKTRTNALIGSLSYMAPERFALGPTTHAADTYSLGCVLYELLAHERLVEVASPAQAALLAADPKRQAAFLEERFGALPADAPDGLLALVRATLSFEAADRPDAAEIRLVCETLADELSGPRLRRWARELPWDDASGHPGALTGHSLSESAGGGGGGPTLGPVTVDRVSAPPADATLDPGALDASSAAEVRSDTFDLPLLRQGTPPTEPQDTLAHMLEGAAQRDPTTVEVARAAGIPGYEPAPPVTEESLEDESSPGLRASWMPLIFGGLGLAAAVVMGVLLLSTDRGAERVGPQAATDVPTDPGEAAPQGPTIAAEATAAAEEKGAAVDAPAELDRDAASQPPRRSSTDKGSRSASSAAPVEAAPPVAEAEPEPEPEPEPEAPAAPGTVRLVGEAQIQLRGATGTHGPGEVPAGRYSLWADFDSGFTEAGSIEVPSGQLVTVRCNHVRWTCTVDG